jgi:thiamine-monophosphate kinase
LGDPDFYHFGRLTVLINVSDLAAMGATPVAILVSTIMPEDMTVSDYRRFLDGVAEASEEWACPVVGGNIKDGAEFSASGSAVGSVPKDCLMLRTGARPGDRVMVVGEMGLFWAAVLHKLSGDPVPGEENAQLLRRAESRPVARIREGIALGRSKLASACMDSSDGVIGCLRELAIKNAASIIVDSSRLTPHPAVRHAAAMAGIDPRKLMLSWGDWQLVFTAPPVHSAPIAELMTALGATCCDIGEVAEGPSDVFLVIEGRPSVLTNFASERFAPTSIFSHGLNAYVDFLRREPLTVDG